jgi:hypothetical protein
MTRLVRWIDLWRIDAATVCMFIVIMACVLLVWMHFEPARPAMTEISQTVYDLNGHETRQFRAGQWFVYYRKVNILNSVWKDADVWIETQNTHVVFIRYSSYRIAPRPVGVVTAVFAYHIPNYMPPGAYEFRLSQTWQQNILKQTTFELPPIKFEVIP